MSDGRLANGDCAVKEFPPNLPPPTLDSVALTAASHRQRLRAARHAFLCSPVEPISTFSGPGSPELLNIVSSYSDASCINRFCNSPVIANSAVISSSAGFDNVDLVNVSTSLHSSSVLQPLTIDCSTYSEHHFPSSFRPYRIVPHGFSHTSEYKLNANAFSPFNADVISVSTSTNSQSSEHPPFSCLLSDELCSKGITSPVTKCLTASPQPEYVNECATRTSTPCTLARDSLHMNNDNTLSGLVRLQPMCANSASPDKTSLIISANWLHRSHMSSSVNRNQYSPVSTFVQPISIPLTSHSTAQAACTTLVQSVMKKQATGSVVPYGKTREQEQVTRSSETPVFTVSHHTSPLSYTCNSRSSTHSTMTSSTEARCCVASSRNSLLQTTASDLKTRKGNLNDNLSKMESTLRNFTSHLSHIDSTLGRMKEFGSISQYLNRVTDENIRRKSQSSSSEDQHTHSESSNSPDSAKSFVYEPHTVDAASPQGGSKHPLPTYSSLGASLTTLSSSIWSSLCPSEYYPPLSSSVQRNQFSPSAPLQSPLSGQPDHSHYSNERVLNTHELESSDTDLGADTSSKTRSADKYDLRVFNPHLPSSRSPNQPLSSKNVVCNLTDRCSCSSTSMISTHVRSQHDKEIKSPSAKQLPDGHRMRSGRHSHDKRFYDNRQHHSSSPELRILPVSHCGRHCTAAPCEHARTASTDRTFRYVKTFDDPDSYTSSSSTPEEISSSVEKRRDIHGLLDRLSHLLLSSREEEARGLIKQLFSTSYSRARLKMLISHLIDENLPRSTEVNMSDKDSSRACQNTSPTGSLLRLAKSLLYATNGRIHTGSNLCLPNAETGPHTPELSNAPSDLSLGESTNSYPSLYHLVPPKHRSAESMTSSHSIQFIKWPSNIQVEEYIPPMHIRPRPSPPLHPRCTILPTPEVLDRLDSKAVEIISSNFVSFTELVRTLISDLTDAVHIVRVLFSWTVAINLLYKEFDQAAPPDSLVGMLRQVKNGQITRCELLLKLCRFAGVHSYLITGYSKGIGYRPGMPLKSNRLFHSAWLAVHVADQWMFVNPDWALLAPKQAWPSSGETVSSMEHNTSALDRAERFCDEFYFLTDPDQHIFQHFPDQKIWQLLHKPISLECFTHLPLLRSPFFNAKLSLKRNYGDCLVTSNGQVTIKLIMPQFVGVSCVLENCADRNILHGLCLVEVLNRMDVVRIQAAPSQPGKYYLHLFISLDWRREYDRELACSFQIHCSEHNYSRLIEMGRLPEVGFLGPTPASRTLGISMCPFDTSGRSFVVHKSADPLRLYFAMAPGLKMIQFKINKEYANRYTESRRKEELQKLRDRYGDVKIGGKRTKTESKAISSEKEEQNDETSDSSSSDSGTSDYSTFSDDDHEDFLVLYDALCRNDASLDDPNKNWFREKADPYTPDEQQVIKTEPDLGNGFYSHTAEKSKKKKQGSLKLRDYERKFLLEDKGLENEDVAADAARISKMESDQILETLTESTADAAKRNFLRESATALEQAGISSTTSPGGSQDLDFLQRRVTDSKNEPRTKIPIDVGNLRFTDTSNAEAEEFLRDYIVNRRWKRPKESLPSYEEVLRNANMNFDSAPLSTTSQLFDGDISEDDEFLIKAREFERANQEGNSVFSRGFDGPTIPKHRFQEEDKEFVKSYPRKIETSLQNPTIDGKSSRSLKREARKARKLKEKQARMEELERLRRMKLAMFADKIDRIRRSCGAGCSIPVVTPDEPFDALKTTSNRRALDLAMYLDEDWDPEQHNKVLEEMFGDSYYGITENEHSLPHFSDISDVDSDELPKVKSERNGFRLTSNGAVSEDSHGSEAVRSSNASDAKGIAIQDHKSSEFSGLFTGRKAHSRRTHHRDKSFSNTTMNPEAEAYFDEHTKLTCDDIIQGSTPDDHIYCRFPYRQVSANDFGLSTEEILKASTRELNSWVSIRRVAGYLTEEEEERNRRVFHSRKKLHKKPQVIASLNDPNAHWWPESNKNPTTSTASGQTKKRSRKKKKNKGVKLEQLVDDISKTKRYSQTKSEAPNPDSTCPRPRTKKIKGLNISLARLSASGLTSKDLYRVRNKSKHTDSSNITSPK